MKKILLITLTCLFVLNYSIYADSKVNVLNEKLARPPYDQINDNDTEIDELEPEELISYEKFSKRDLIEQAEDGLWSTIWGKNLDWLNISVYSSSTLKGYNVTNLFDKNISTAWVEGAKNDGIDEWISININAGKTSLSSTPFTIYWVGIISGYSKSKKTWEENNKLKSALLVIYSPDDPSWEYAVCRLKFKDYMGLQVFRLPDYLVAPTLYPMTKKVWLIIKDVYKGTKYSDTCISEIVLRGGCLP